MSEEAPKNTPENAIVPVEQKEVEFYDTTIYAVRDADGRVLVPLRPVCTGLGLNWSGQLQRIRRDEVLKEEMGVCVIHTPGGQQEMISLPLEFLQGWLFGISANRVKPELRSVINNYRREVYRVLYEAFQEGRLSLDGSFEDALDSADPETVQAYQMAQAVVRLARNQILLQAEVGRHGEELEEHGRRLDDIEDALAPADRNITESQASQISQAVKVVAMELTKTSGSNQYGSVYGELYRKFGIKSYKLLPASKFQEAMDWLTEMFEQITEKEGF